MWQPNILSLIEMCHRPDKCFATCEKIRPTNCWSSVMSYIQHFSRFFEVFQRQELLELASNNWVLVFKFMCMFSCVQDMQLGHNNGSSTGEV